MDQPLTYHLGTLEVQIQGDILFLKPHGPLDNETAHELMRLLAQVHAQHGRHCILVDLQDAGPIPPHLRRLMAEHEGGMPPIAAAFFGGTTATRGVNALMRGAIKAVTGRSENIRHFETEAEARAWIAERHQGTAES